MTIKLVQPGNESEFITHARTETLRTHGEEVTPAAVAPCPFGAYYIAYNDENRPVAMAEVAFHDQVYQSFAKSPYPASLNLDQFCSIGKMVGIRTIYVEPEYRQRAGSLYFALILAGARTSLKLGARFATATTDAKNAYLKRLYGKTGGLPLPTIRMEGLADCDVAPWIFNVRDLVNNKLIQRGAAGARIEIDMNLARTLRARSLWDQQRKCA